MGRNIENILVGIICLFFLYYAVQAVFVSPTFRLVYVLLPALFLTLLPLLFEYRFRILFPSGTKVLIGLALLLHVAGGINFYYWRFAPYYDKVAHVVSACALMIVIFCFFMALDWQGKRVSLNRAVLLTIVITVVFSLAWEYAEFYIDVLVKSSYNNGIGDTIGDIISNLIGMVIALLLIRYNVRKIPPGEGIGWLLTRGRQ